VAGEGVFSGREFRIAQVAEAEFIERGRPDDVGVAECEGLIADETQLSISGKSSWVEVVGIVKAVATEYGVFGAHKLVDPDVELIKVIRPCAAVEIVQAWIAIRAKTSGNVGQRIEETRKGQRLRRDWIETVPKNDVAGEGVADNASIDCPGGSRVVDGAAKDRAAQCIGSQLLRGQVP